MTPRWSTSRALLERLLDRVDDLESELSEYRAENEYDKATIRQDVNEAIEKAEATGPAPDAESGESTAQDDSMGTPMEQTHPGRRGRRDRPCDRQRRTR